MMISKPLGHVTIRVALGAVALLCWASVAKAVDSQVVFEKVKTSVVQVNIGKGSLGSGCVLDPKEGIIVTNFHVIEHAKGEKVTVAFPADGDGKTYPVEGYLEIVPTKDIALIRIDPSKRKLKPLKIAASLPSPGEHVYAFGSPLGLSLSFTEGPVSAIRTGKQVSDIADQMFGKGMYEKEQGYDFEATWVQHAAPISPGNSGGPLTNANGELLGLNTWHLTQGQNLNFAISAVNVQQVLSKASRVVKKFSSLPPPRKRAPSGMGPGDMETTRATW
ncbi:MAG: serine protease, partial [Planctomycetaceae bacterium]|nr:serine protease [Planctomycetaceae bacterium]